MRSATAPGLTVNEVRKARERNRLWCAEHRSVTRRNPWLVGAPPYGTHLPGGGFSLAVHPAPKWPVELRNTRALHGMVTKLSGIAHHPTIPQFALIPWPSPFGWSVWTQHEDAARALAGKAHSAILYDREVTVTCGPLARVRAPIIRRRGRRMLRVDTITPVLIRAADGGRCTVPTSGNLRSTLHAWLPRRVGVEIDADDLCLEIRSRSTQSAIVDTGGKFGASTGFTGHIIVETNAVGHWLLDVASRIGLGGRVALGFGRIRLSEIDKC